MGQIRACGDLCTARVGVSSIAFLLLLPNFNLLETSITMSLAILHMQVGGKMIKRRRKKGYLLSLVTHSNVPKTTWKLFLINISKQTLLEKYYWILTSCQTLCSIPPKSISSFFNTCADKEKAGTFSVKDHYKVTSQHYDKLSQIL